MNCIQALRHGCKSLDGSNPALWFVLVLKYLESYSYFALSQILVIYLHNEFGYTDIEAGTIYGVWGLCITLCGFTLACLSDYLGVRVALMIGFAVSTIAYTCLALVRQREGVLFLLFFLLPIGSSLGMYCVSLSLSLFLSLYIYIYIYLYTVHKY